MREATRKAREEARIVAQRERDESRERRKRKRRERSRRWDVRTENLTLRLRSPGRTSRRRAAAVQRNASGRPTILVRVTSILRRVLSPFARLLAPVGTVAGRALAAVAPYASRGLMFVLRVPAALIAIGLDVVLDAAGWLRVKVGPLAAGLMVVAMRVVTPVRALAFVCAGAAVALVASQFIDYRGVAVGAPGYEGEISAVAPAPFTDLETTGSAHSYVMIPLAALAVVLAVLTARGRWRLGRAVGLIGLAGIVVSLAVDMPQGLDAGDSGVSYLGTDARLIEGFWAQMAASATLLVAGPLLGHYAKRAAAPDRTLTRSERRAARERRRRSKAGFGGESVGAAS